MTERAMRTDHGVALVAARGRGDESGIAYGRFPGCGDPSPSCGCCACAVSDPQTNTVTTANRDSWVVLMRDTEVKSAKICVNLRLNRAAVSSRRLTQISADCS